MIDAAMISYEKKIKKIKSAVIILELGTLGHILVTVKRIMIIKMQILGSKFLRISLRK